ncbi:ImmA/IrrE family metallo-endopeptidase [Tepidibacter formicigenes]|jgi:Zn-dependent peptidase ImmA (M78 family)|uniref:Zn-dependent peptidase ImmA, M78 family n=1 Tax=Tepidibacter formicigenes DSM 15518 TaxID=1123349 RepID=A0A1M6QPT6_9FIRM|nr:ImmA/IrrE family metallo-endopeptidase [Tepidibacter formicigenes]SHK22271.1 Zn-dependent peptidase ImmA, M78 family [Tepidibacter formicigenes DSM 15518]
MLKREEIDKIEKKALQHRKMNDLGIESPIGNKIFDIIENQYDSFLLLYPLKSENIAGFTRKQGEFIQVFINTSFDKGFQNFACAHELYHLIQFQEKEIDSFIVCSNKDISETLDEENMHQEELKANYFAATFLLPKEIVVERFKKIEELYYSEEDFILEIIKLQYQYEVPFKTILKRLKELEIINEIQYGKLKIYEDNIIEYCKMMDEFVYNNIKTLESPDARKYHTLNVPKTAADVYKNNIISFSKLESIINKYDKKITDFNINKPQIKPINIDFSSFGIGDDDDYDEEN